MSHWICQRIGRLRVLAVALWAVLMLTDAARADCDVTESGIPKDAVAAIDFSGTRKSLAESGIGIGGFYAAETFGNPSGGIKQGATYDGVLELHLDGDMKKMGLWKGLCFYANGYQIHGHSIAAENIGSLAPRRRACMSFGSSRACSMSVCGSGSANSPRMGTSSSSKTATTS